MKKGDDRTFLNSEIPIKNFDKCQKNSAIEKSSLESIFSRFPKPSPTQNFLSGIPDKFTKFKKSPRGLSTVVATVIMILLVMTITAVVWTSIGGLVEEETSRTQNCFDVGLSDKVTINEVYTCYNTTDSSNKKMQFSISIGDVEIDSLLISISSAGSSKTYTLTNELSNSSGLLSYPDENINVQLPGKNAGKTYFAPGFSADTIDRIEISPIVGGNACESTDTITQIDNCELLVN